MGRAVVAGVGVVDRLCVAVGVASGAAGENEGGSGVVVQVHRTIPSPMVRRADLRVGAIKGSLEAGSRSDAIPGRDLPTGVGCQT
jgi:hypothetical protein